MHTEAKALGRPDVLVIQMGRPPQVIVDQLGDQGGWFRAALAPTGVSVAVVHPYRGEPLPPIGQFGATVVTGAWEMVTDRLEASERTGAWLAGLIDAAVPVLGVCYGHQLMADVLGGRVDYHPAGRESGTQTVNLLPAADNDPVASVLPARFAAQLSHRQSVLEAPPGAVVLAATGHDGHQLLRYGPTALSCQFHPEFTEAHMRACLQTQRAGLLAEGRNPDAMLAAVAATPVAGSLLAAFVAGDLAALHPRSADGARTAPSG